MENSTYEEVMSDLLVEVQTFPKIKVAEVPDLILYLMEKVERFPQPEERKEIVINIVKHIMGLEIRTQEEEKIVHDLIPNILETVIFVSHGYGDFTHGTASPQYCCCCTIL